MNGEALQAATNGLSQWYGQLSGKEPDAKTIEALRFIYDEVYELLREKLGEPPTEAQTTEACEQIIEKVRRGNYPSQRGRKKR